MIPVSLLLILVAVALLALGLTSGSSGLLIVSIVASLLAAIALVIGARRTAGARRATPGRLVVASPEAVADPEPEVPSPEFAAEFAAAQTSGARTYGAQTSGARAAAPPPARDDFSASPTVFAGDPSDYPTVEHPAAMPDLDLGDEAPWPTREQVFATQPIAEPEVVAATGADYDRASSAINAARSEQSDENAWRRDTHAEAAAHAGAPDLPAFGSSGGGGPSFGSSGRGEDDEFAEADVDDPDDEPLPQSVQPADAVRVARMDAEVLVVDGRPRYHLADCAHLVGRLTEPIPVNEAVELGFSPCGLCRPVDRLVAAAARG
jgi:hypothetical protein